VYGENKLSAQVKDEEFASSSHAQYIPISNSGQEIGEVGVANCAFPENKGFANCCAYDGFA
jgi:hypothetical protein